jgi:hypothetical protein
MIEQGSTWKKSVMTEQRNLQTRALEWWLKEKIGNDLSKKTLQQQELQNDRKDQLCLSKETLQQ